MAKNQSLYLDSYYKEYQLAIVYLASDLILKKKINIFLHLLEIFLFQQFIKFILFHLSDINILYLIITNIILKFILNSTKPH